MAIYDFQYRPKSVVLINNWIDFKRNNPLRRDFSLRPVKNRWRYKSGEKRLNKNDNDDLYQNRLKLSELKEIKGFENISDDEGEAFINDAMAFARMLIQVIK